MKEPRDVYWKTERIEDEPSDHADNYWRAERIDRDRWLVPAEQLEEALA